MEWETIAKVAIAVVGIITTGIAFFNILIRKKTNLREEYDFAKKFLDDTHKQELHPFTLSKGYQAIAGTDTVKSSEIEYILSLKDPVQCLSDYILSKPLFEMLQTEGDFKLVFLKKYKSAYSRNWRKLTYLALYLTLALFAISPLLFSGLPEIDTENSLISLLFTLPFFGSNAWMSLQAYAKLARGEFLFNNQKQHNSNIFVDGFDDRVAN